MKYDPKLLAVAAAALLFTIGAVAFGLSLKNPGPSAQPAVAPAPPEAKNNAEAVFAPDKVASVKTEEVAYFGETKGFYARPDDGNTYPGVVMIHEWWGLNDAIKTMARHLAGQGYAVLAVDLYDGKVGGTPDEARVLVSAFDPERGLENMRAAQAYLRTHGSTKIASLGWCFGGGQSLQMALAEPLDATV